MTIRIQVKVLNIIKSTEFSKLKKEEKEKGFIEATKFSNFFSEGKKEQWKEKLNKNQIKKLEKKFRSVMKKFDYI